MIRQHLNRHLTQDKRRRWVDERHTSTRSTPTGDSGASPQWRRSAHDRIRSGALAHQCRGDAEQPAHAARHVALVREACLERDLTVRHLAAAQQ